MSIEIKELHIKIKIEDDKQPFPQKNVVSHTDLEALKQQIIRECTSRIMEKLKEKEER